MKGRKCVIVRYDEIGLKSKPVKKRFENILISNIKKKINASVKIKKKRMRILLYTNESEKVSELVSKVFGVNSASPCIELEQDLNIMKREAVKLYTSGSFRISCQRVSKEFPLTSQEVCEKVGAHVVKETKASVNLEDYDINIQIELFNNKAYLFTKCFKGYGGLPVGASSEVLSIVNNELGVLSTLLIMNRGCKPLITGDKKFYEKLNKFTPHLNLKYYENYEKVMKKCSGVIIGRRLNEFKQFEKDKNEFNKAVFYPLIGLNPDVVERKYFEC